MKETKLYSLIICRTLKIVTNVCVIFLKWEADIAKMEGIQGSASYHERQSPVEQHNMEGMVHAM